MVQPLATRLASILRSADARAAGFLVAAGIRSMADDIAADLCPVGCADCALRVLQGLPACADCAEAA